MNYKLLVLHIKITFCYYDKILIKLIKTILAQLLIKKILLIFINNVEIYIYGIIKNNIRENVVSLETLCIENINDILEEIS